MNYDDIEFNTIDNVDSTVESFVDKHFLNDVKFKIIDYVIVLNKQNGVFYISNSKIVDIKYTSGWVNIPIYNFLLTEILKFIITPDYSMIYLQEKLNDIIEYTPNDQLFGYKDDILSNSYNATDNVPIRIKKLFIANTINKFAKLFNNL